MLPSPPPRFTSTGSWDSTFGSIFNSVAGPVNTSSCGSNASGSSSSKESKAPWRVKGTPLGTETSSPDPSLFTYCSTLGLLSEGSEPFAWLSSERIQFSYRSIQSLEWFLFPRVPLISISLQAEHFRDTPCSSNHFTGGPVAGHLKSAGNGTETSS